MQPALGSSTAGHSCPPPLRCLPPSRSSTPLEPLMFSQTVEYALRAAVALARVEDTSLTGREISETTQVPPRYLTKVLSELIKGGLIHGSRGVGGGYKLARHADGITLLDVVDAIEPMRRITTCPLGISQHGDKLCSLHSQLDQAIAHVQQLLAKSSLADLAGSIETCGHSSAALCGQPTPLSIDTIPKNL